MAQSWIHLAREMAPQVPELPAVIQQEVAALNGTEISEDRLTQVARAITKRVDDAGHPEVAATLLRRMGRAMYELLLLLATEEELRMMGMLMDAAAHPPAVASPVSPPGPVGAMRPGPGPSPSPGPPANAPPPMATPSSGLGRRPASPSAPVPPRTVPPMPARVAAAAPASPPGVFEPGPVAQAQPPGPNGVPGLGPVSRTGSQSASPAAPPGQVRPGVSPAVATATSVAAPAPPMRPPAGQPASAPAEPVAKSSAPTGPAAGPGRGGGVEAGANPEVPAAVRAAPPARVAETVAEEAVLWGFDPSAREAQGEVAQASAAGATSGPASEPAIAVESTPASPAPEAPSQRIAVVAGERLNAHGWSVRLSPRTAEERDRRLQKRSSELPTLLEEISTQVHEQRHAVSDRGMARQAVRAAAEQSAPADLQSATSRLGDLLEGGRLTDAAALALRTAEAFPGEVSAELACRAGEASRHAKDDDLATLCFTTAVLAAPPCEAACWQLAGMALEQREPLLAPVWMEFVARLLRVRGADEDAVVVYRQLLNLAPRRQDVRDILRLASLTGILPD